MTWLRRAGRRLLQCSFLVLPACGAKPAPTWIEYDVPIQAHASTQRGEIAPGAPAPSDLPPHSLFGSAAHPGTAGASDLPPHSLFGSAAHPGTAGASDLPPHSLFGSAAHPGTAGASDVAHYSPNLIDTLNAVQVRAALQRLADQAPAAHLALRAARLSHHVGDDAGARAMVARAATAADEPQVHAELVALAAELASPAVDDATIAVLLPLTGRFAAVGAELRAAIEIAPARGTKWLFLDTRGEPAGAVAAVEHAIANHAVAALGPVGSRELVAAARAAAPHRLPIAALAPDDGADSKAGVFRMVNSAKDEARAVAALALSDNFSTVAVFAPRDDIGQDAVEAFVAEAQRLGLTVAQAGSYDPTGGDVERDVKRFLNLVPATNARLAQHLRSHGDKGWQSFSPDVAFSLLYIPDRFDRAAVVAAFLPYFGVELRATEFTDAVALRRKHGGHVPQVVQLIGGAGWNHPSLPIRGGSAVQGARIVDVFAGERGGELAAQFAAEFQRKTGRLPSSAAAQAYDAAALVAVARTASHAPTVDARQAYRAALASAKLEDGACGPAAMASDGEVVRSATILEVQGDELRVVE